MTIEKGNLNSGKRNLRFIEASQDKVKDLGTILQLWEVNSVWEALSLLNQFASQYDMRRNADERQKIATWPEIYESFFDRLGMNPRDSRNKKRTLKTVATACSKINGTSLQNFYSALDTSDGKVHEFLQTLEAVFIEKWYIRRHGKRAAS